MHQKQPPAKVVMAASTGVATGAGNVLSPIPIPAAANAAMVRRVAVRFDLIVASTRFYEGRATPVTAPFGGRERDGRSAQPSPTARGTGVRAQLRAGGR